MRTKTLLLTAALGVASIATSMAQAVYSVNVVGYINLPMKPGFNLVANQLNVSPANTISAVIPTADEESQVLKFSGGNYSGDIFLGGWLNAITGNPSTTTVSPGEGFFFFNPTLTDKTVTLVGEVKQGSSTVPLNPGFNLVSTVVPQAIPLTPGNGFPVDEEWQYLSFNAMVQNYDTALIYLSGQWLDSVSGTPTLPTPAVGQGYFVFNAGLTLQNWTRIFNIP